MLATIVDITELWQTVVAALIAALGMTFTFSLVILGVARLADRARDDRPVAATGAGLLAATGLVLTVAGLALGMVVMLSK